MTTTVTVTVTVSPKGEVRGEVNGVAGPSCKDLTDLLASALGVKTGEQAKAEYFQTRETGQRLRQEN